MKCEHGEGCEVCKLLNKNDGDVDATVDELADLMCKFVDDAVVAELLADEE